ncbi:MAG: hypothetical protein KDJ35_05215 [Alphaproteobacteria bacterium]|nr:hypothetical protein [Alphaproteobacteria bacterium]
MHHKYAVIFNKNTGVSKRWSPKRFSQYLKELDDKEKLQNPGYSRPHDFVRENYEIISLEDANPMFFVDAYKRLGFDKSVNPYFAHAAGYAREDHLYERSRKTYSEKITQAIQDGKKFLLTLNADTSHLLLDFRAMKGEGGQTLESWLKTERRDYMTISVKSAQDVISRLKSLYKNGLDKKEFKDRISVLYRGGVLPYDDFFIGSNQKKLKALFSRLQNLDTGVPMKQGTRVLGFPRMIIFKPTPKMIETPYAEFPKGNMSIAKPGLGKAKDISYSQLIFAEENIRAGQIYKDLVANIVDPKKDVYILSSASITSPAPPRAATKVLWELLRWNISDITSQTYAVDKKPKNVHKVSSAPETPAA